MAPGAGAFRKRTQVSVDLLRVPQDEYAVLTRGERIVVIGVVTDGRRSVIGTSVVRGSDAQAP